LGTSGQTANQGSRLDSGIREKSGHIPEVDHSIWLPPYSPEPNHIETLFSVLKHRHLPNRMSGSIQHVRTVVEEVWDGFICQKDEVTRVRAKQWAVA